MGVDTKKGAHTLRQRLESKRMFRILVGPLVSDPFPQGSTTPHSTPFFR